MACPLRFFLCAPLLAALISVAAFAADSNQQEIAAVRAAAAHYIKALEAGDTAAMAAAWTPKGDYVDATGNSFDPHERIARAASRHARGAAPPNVTIDAVRLAAPGVAIVDGRIERAAADGKSASSTRYSAVWLKHDGRWLLDSVRESAAAQASVNTHFADLQWLLGEFTGRSAEGAHVVMTASMSHDGNFLLREIMVTLPDGQVKSLSQRIGWDPISGRFKSWTFDSDGGYGEGLWKREGESWIVNSTSVSPDGKRSSSTGIYSQISADGITVLFSGATVEGEPRPDAKFKLTRETQHD